MAHLWAYGSGFRTLEFVQPEYDDAWDFFVGSPEQQASAHRSQHSMRFPLLPGFFWVLFRLCILLGVDDYHNHVVPFAQTVFAATTATLPAAVYGLLRVLCVGEQGARSAALLSGVLVAAHPALATLGGNALLNSFLAPFTFAGLAGWCGPDTSAALRALSGAALAVAVYARCDLLLLCGAFAVAHPLQVLGGFRRASVLAATAAVAAMATVDWAVFGFPLATPVRWFVFNVVLGHSHRFGTAGGDFYLRLLVNDPMLRALGVVGLGALAWLVATTSAALRSPRPLARTIVPKALRLALAGSVVIVVYSFSAHKEGRFIHDALVLLLAAPCLLLAPLAALVPARLGSPHAWLKPPLLAAAVAISTQAPRALAGGTRPSGADWFAPFWGSARRWQQQTDVNAAITFVGARGNVTGLMLRMPPSGGNGHLAFACTWTCLHVAAPIAVLRPDNHVQVFAPTINTRVCTAPVLAMPAGGGEDQQVQQLHRTSRWVLRNRHFNYLVTPAPLAPRLAALGFHTIAEFGSAIVAQRRAASEARADPYDYYSMWTHHARGWLCHQYFRHAAPVPIAADVRLGVPLPGGGTGEHAISRGDSARDGSVELCMRMGRRADDFECLYEMHGAIAVATVEHVYSNDAAKAKQDALSAASTQPGGRIGFAGGVVNEHADDAECARWAMLGECERNPSFMKSMCAASCAMADVREPPLPLKRALAAKLPAGQVLSVHRAYLEVEVPRYEHAFVALLSPSLDADTRRGVSDTLRATAQQFAVAQPHLDLLFAEAIVGLASEDSARVEEAGGVLCLFFTRHYRNPRFYEGGATEARAIYAWVDRTIRTPDTEQDPARRYALSPSGDVLGETREVKGFDKRLQAFARETRDDSYRAFNPSIHGEAAGEMWVAFRVSNNTRCAGVDVWKYVGLQQMLLSDLGVCRVGEDLLPVAETCHYVHVDFEVLARQSAQEGGSWTQTQGLIRGYEDPRLFRLNGRWAMLVTVLVSIWSVEASGCRVALVLLDDSLRRVTEARILSIDDMDGAYTPARFEKNWAPFVVKTGSGEEVLLLAYSFVPLVFLRPSMRDGRCTRVEVVRRDDGSISIRPARPWQQPKLNGAPQVTTAFGFGSPSPAQQRLTAQQRLNNELPRGGSQLIQLDDGRWMGLTHARVETYLGPLYNTHFVELVPNPTGPANEEDDAECARWAAQGECQSNSDFMEESCAASCASDEVKSRGLLRLQLSLPFRFPRSNASKAAKQAIQMVMGMTPRRAYEKKKTRWGRTSASGEMIVSYGIGDCSAHLALTTLKTFQNLNTNR